MGYLLQELRRRNVFRVGAAYAVVSWLIIQVIETISEPLGLPGWTEAFFIVLLATVDRDPRRRSRRLISPS